jgi:hypothetical protein
MRTYNDEGRFGFWLRLNMHLPEGLHRPLRLDLIPTRDRTVARVTDFAPPDENCACSDYPDAWSGKMARVRQPEWHRESHGHENEQRSRRDDRRGLYGI